MNLEKHENQLELFALSRTSAPRVRRETLGRLQFHLRYDQLVLTAMAGVIGLTIVFAGGVERGKQLVRSERAWLVRQPPEAAAPQQPVTRQEPPLAVPRAGSRSQQDGGTTPKSDRHPAPKPSPTKLASDADRYAVQVVTYSRPQWAKRELERLQADGEQAFLVRRNGHTSVYVGPFPSRLNAAQHLSRLRQRYHDCFVKSL